MAEPLRVLRKEWVFAYLLLTPLFVLLSVFAFIRRCTHSGPAFFSKRTPPARFSLGFDRCDCHAGCSPDLLKFMLKTILGTPPLSISVSMALALLMALWPTGPSACQPGCAAYFTPTMLPSFSRQFMAVIYTQFGFAGSDCSSLSRCHQLVGPAAKQPWVPFMVVTIWKEAGLHDLCLAALQTIPPSSARCRSILKGNTLAVWPWSCCLY